MENRRLGSTDVSVSAICLGSMTWGEQNTQEQAFEQMDYAFAQGINFFDTAEMYPVPPKADTQGRTETYIGNWLKAHGKRKNIILASKVSGRADWLPWIRGGPVLSRKHIFEAIDGSLKRLQTDYLDLYQLHWPDRNTNYFGKLGYEHKSDEATVALQESLSAMGELLQAGKLRHIGISNETPWGLMQCVQLAEKLGLPKPVSIQNPYSLLNRSFEVGLAECAHREDVGLLAYSPLAFGALSGKYLNGQWPAGARLTLFKRFSRYTNPQAEQATAKYVLLAQNHGLDPAQMALAFVTSRPFLTSNIIGATTMEQLKSNIASSTLRLSDEVLKGIEAIHLAHPNPAP
ncbi:MAG: NADP(H)-dependent aldo-keto reductase [Nevskiales bacterium]